MEETLYSFMLSNRKKYIASAESFYRIFNVSLENFWSNITGFDVVKFDEELIKPPDGKSTADVVKETYGADALAFVEGLF